MTNDDFEPITDDDVERLIANLHSTDRQVQYQAIIQARGIQCRDWDDFERIDDALIQIYEAKGLLYNVALCAASHLLHLNTPSGSVKPEARYRMLKAEKHIGVGMSQECIR